MEYYIDEIQDYIEALAISHTEVAHTKNGKVCFAGYLTEEHINQITNKGGKNIVVIAEYSGQVIGDFEEDKARQTLQVLFLVKKETATGNRSNEIRTAIKKSLSILFDFLSKMKKDYKDDDCGPLKGLEPERASWNIFNDQPFLDEYYGYELNIPWKSNLPPYNVAKWSN
jgi:hypothetical protein